MIESDKCSIDKIQILDLMKNLINSLWKILGKTQPIQVLEKVMKKFKTLSASLSSLYNQSQVNEQELLERIIKETTEAFNYVLMRDDRKCVERIKSESEFCEMFIATLSKCVEKLLIYEIKVSSENKDLNLVTVNIVAERSFSIVKHWESRFTQLGIVQACEIGKAFLNKTTDYIESLTDKEIDNYHRRKIAKNTQKLEKNEQKDYDNIVRANRLKAISTQTDKDEWISKWSTLMYEEPDFIPTVFTGEFKN